jgi:uncharacterized protein (TIGR03382 family)
MRLWPVVVLVVGCEADFGVATSEVIGGDVTPAGAFPGVGALMYDLGGGPQAGCTGTLIAPNAVLTAAHCVDPQLTGGVTPGFTLALDTTVGTPVIVPATMTIKHEQFSLDNIPEDGLGEFFDVGIVLLAQPITEVAPVLMPRPVDSAELVANLDLEIAGYGKTTVQGDATGILFDAQTKLISLNATELQVGMGSPQPQNCNGDSGGPGFAVVGGERRVVGIVSRSFSGLECTSGGVDTRVDAYVAWIHSKVPVGIPCDSGMSEPCPVEEEEGGDEDGGCCSTGGASVPSTSAVALLVGLLLFRRRRRG